MKALASVDFLNLQDTAFPLPNGVDSLHAKPATRNEPRNHQLGHSDTPEGRRKPFLVADLRPSGDRWLAQHLPRQHRHKV
jgi:hypothetical protein